MGYLVSEYAVVLYDPADAVFMKLALIEHFAAGVYRQEFARLVSVVFIFDGLF